MAKKVRRSKKKKRSNSIFAKIERELGLKNDSLKAVIYYSDRSYTKVIVYGPNRIDRSKLGRNNSIKIRPKGQIKMPDPGDLKPDYVMAGRRYGFNKGDNVLLISGMPD